MIAEMLTYRRAHDSQGEADFIQRFIMPAAPEVIAAPDGTVRAYVVTIPRTDGSAAPYAFCAHTDTVHNRQNPAARQPVGFDATRCEFFVNDPVQRDCLGADDGAGCYVLLRMIAAQTPGLYVFFRGEERGGIGSQYVVANRPDIFNGIDCAIGFDRRGCESVITHMFCGRTCSDEFADSLADALGMGHSRDDTGSFTDTANLAAIVPECTNVSVGYEREHIAAETLDARYLRALASRLVAVFSGDGPGGLVIARAPGDFADGVEDMETPELAYMRDDDLDWLADGSDPDYLRRVLAEARDYIRAVSA